MNQRPPTALVICLHIGQDAVVLSRSLLYVRNQLFRQASWATWPQHVLHSPLVSGSIQAKQRSLSITLLGSIEKILLENSQWVSTNDLKSASTHMISWCR